MSKPTVTHPQGAVEHSYDEEIVVSLLQQLRRFRNQHALRAKSSPRQKGYAMYSQS